MRQETKNAAALPPIVKEYSRLAERYDSRWSFYVEMTVRETAARLGLSGAERLLDVGCGTGELLRHLSAAHPAPLLSGIDPVAEMLSVARRKLGTAIDLREGWAENLPFDSQRFDVVVSCNMFHYILHPADSLGEMRRVLRPGGRLVITIGAVIFGLVGCAIGICGFSDPRILMCIGNRRLSCYWRGLCHRQSCPL